MSEFLAKLTSLLLLSGTFWFLGLPLEVDALIFFLILILVIKSKSADSYVFLFSIILSFCLLEIGYRAFPTQNKVLNEVQKYGTADGNFEKNVDDTIETFGDMVNISPSEAKEVEEIKKFHFKTDNLGNRNDQNYKDQKFILSGDSFTVGINTDQKDTLVNILKREKNIDSYSLAYPGAPTDYFKKISQFLPEHNSISVLMFVFEGNDFFNPTPNARGMAIPNAYDRLKLQTFHRFKNYIKVNQSLFNISRQLKNKFFSNEKKIEVYNIGPLKVGFYGNYVDAAIAKQLDLSIVPPPGASLEGLMSHVDGVFFVPTKYRVYFDLMTKEDQGSRTLVYPPPGLVSLKELFELYDIPVIDLTDALKTRAKQLLPDKKLVFWRDDSHWNNFGIEAAANEVERFLKNKKKYLTKLSVLQDFDVPIRLKKNSSDEIGWTLIKNADDQGLKKIWFDFENQFFKKFSVPEGASVLQSRFEIESDTVNSSILMDLVFFDESGKELKRLVKSAVGSTAQSTFIEAKDRLPAHTSQVLIIFRPWRNEDGKIALKSGRIQWLK